MRVISRVFCTALAVVLAVVSFIAVVEIALAAFSQDAWLVDSRSWFDTLSGLTWSSSGLRLALALVGVAGLLFLVVAWAPRRKLTVPLSAVTTDAVALSVRRREAEELVRSRVTVLPYVTDVEAVVTAERVDVSAHATRDDAAVNGAVQASVADTVDQLGLGDVERRIRVRRSAGRVA